VAAGRERLTFVLVRSPDCDQGSGGCVDVLALDESGDELWRQPLVGDAYQGWVAVRGDEVIVLTFITNSVSVDGVTQYGGVGGFSAVITRLSTADGAALRTPTRLGGFMPSSLAIDGRRRPWIAGRVQSTQGVGGWLEVTEPTASNVPCGALVALEDDDLPAWSEVSCMESYLVGELLTSGDALVVRRGDGLTGLDASGYVTWSALSGPTRGLAPDGEGAVFGLTLDSASFSDSVLIHVDSGGTLRWQWPGTLAGDGTIDAPRGAGLCDARIASHDDRNVFLGTSACRTAAELLGVEEPGDGYLIAHIVPDQLPAFEPGCGNGWIDPGEACDGAALSGENCLSMTEYPGELRCSRDCKQYDTSDCGRLCGNGVADPDECCDQGDFREETCASYTGESSNTGKLRCDSHCAIDYSDCYAAP
jgi:hypothetical protein